MLDPEDKTEEASSTEEYNPPQGNILKNPEIEQIPHEARQHLLKLSEVSIWLDTYDDIFSDFDPRPYSQRSLSDDFLAEVKKATREKTSGRIELRFLIPQDKRNLNDEAVIRRRLHEYFKKQYFKIEREVKKTRNRSILGVFAGFILMASASYISTVAERDLFYNMLRVLIEPGGWFITWFSLDQLFYSSSQKKQELNFYQKMSKAEIAFISY